MKQILISIKPKWVAKILNGEKTLEIRKTAPKEWADYLKHIYWYNPDPKPNYPYDVFIYCTKSDYIGHISNKYVGKVVAKFMLREVRLIDFWVMYPEWGQTDLADDVELKGQMTAKEVDDYLSNKDGYAWYISDLEIFDEPKELSEFGVKRAPESFCYIEID